MADALLKKGIINKRLKEDEQRKKYISDNINKR